MRTAPNHPDLLWICELQDVRLFEAACRNQADAAVAVREAGEGCAVEDQRWDIHVRIQAETLECRARVLVETAGCRYFVDIAASYRMTGSPTGTFGDLPRERVVDFVERHALPALFPYIRAEIQQGAVKVGGNRSVFRALSLEGVCRALFGAFPEPVNRGSGPRGRPGVRHCGPSASR